MSFKYSPPEKETFDLDVLTKEEIDHTESLSYFLNYLKHSSRKNSLSVDVEITGRNDASSIFEKITNYTFNFQFNFSQFSSDLNVCTINF